MYTKKVKLNEIVAEHYKLSQIIKSLNDDLEEARHKFWGGTAALLTCIIMFGCLVLIINLVMFNTFSILFGLAAFGSLIVVTCDWYNTYYKGKNSPANNIKQIKTKISELKL